jgi:hypothetical protein
VHNCFTLSPSIKAAFGGGNAARAIIIAIIIPA